MATARSHPDLICWQRAYEVKRLVYVLIRSTNARRDFEFRKQLREAASAAPRLMAEGFGRYYPAEFARYQRLAKRSSKAACRLAAYLDKADPPSGPPPRRRRPRT